MPLVSLYQIATWSASSSEFDRKSSWMARTSTSCVYLSGRSILKNILGGDLNLPQSSCIFLSWVVLLSGCPFRTLTHQQFVSSHCFDSKSPSLRQIALPPDFKKSVQGFFAISYSRKGLIVTSSLPADMVTANA